MGRSIRKINGIVGGEDALTHRISLELEVVLDIPAQFWLNLESAYRMTMARNENRAGLNSKTEELSHFSP